ncbi:MAG: LuxR C-terminal-related transcriptional regulator, partial [Methanosarcina sp.]|nr:LuxR C-terminal-related transcriptional regulator [Methanosarcina sp.]
GDVYKRQLTCRRDLNFSGGGISRLLSCSGRLATCSMTFGSSRKEKGLIQSTHTMTLSCMEQGYRFMINLGISSIALAIGIFILKRDTKNTLNRLALLICIWFVVRNSAAHLTFLFSTVKEDVILLYKLSSFFFNTILALNLHFYLYMKEKKGIRIWKLALIYLPALLMSFIPIIDYRIYSNIVNVNGNWIFRLSYDKFSAHLFSVYIVLYWTITVAVAFLNLKQSRLHREKRQAAVLIAGYSFYIVFQIFVYGMTARNPQTATLFVFPSVIYVLALFYAVSKYRFLVPEPSLVAENIIFHISDMVLILDRDQRIISANNRVEELLSVSLDSLKGESLYWIIRSYDTLRERLAVFPDSTDTSFSQKVTYQKGEEIIVTDTYFSKIKDKFSDVVGTLIISKEIYGWKEFQRMYGISGRELEIVLFILRGYSARSIAEELNISKRTVETHFINIYDKLGITKKAELFKFSTMFNFFH